MPQVNSSSWILIMMKLLIFISIFIIMTNYSMFILTKINNVKFLHKMHSFMIF